MKLPSHLAISRYGIYYLRIERNGIERRRSLGTRDPFEAIAAAYKFGATMFAMTNQKRSLGYTVKSGLFKVTTDGSAEDHARAMEALSAVKELDEEQRAKVRAEGELELKQIYEELAVWRKQQPQQLQQQPTQLWTLKQCLDDYITERGEEWTDSTHRTYNSAFKKLIGALGATTPISDIDTSRFVAFRKTLDATLHPDTIIRDAGAWRGLFDWAINRQRYILPNPIETARHSPAQRARLVRERAEPREPFNADDLKKIFTVIPKMNKPCAYWLPTIALMTGARLGELCAVRLEHIREYERGKWSLLIDDGKTEASRRDIPLHQHLIDAGLLDYIKDVKRCWPDAERLFPYLVEASKNGYGNMPGRDFSAFKQGLGLGNSKTFHSFRKTLISCLQYNGCLKEHRKPFVGHEHDDGKSDDVHDNYSMAHFNPARLAELIFPHLDYVQWLGYTPTLPKYTAGQFDSYFAKIGKQQMFRVVRAAREDRSTARKSGKQ